MSYIINLTDGTVLATVLDGTTNTQTGLTIIGRNYPSYGEVQNENFVRLLESFADSVPPDQSVATMALTGTVWYDTTNQRLCVYDGTNWSTVSERITSSTEPTTSTYTLKSGDQWFDTVNKQLKVWIDSAWYTVGPLVKTSLGTSGSIPEVVTDTLGNTHVIVKTYSMGNVISVNSFDSQFTPVAPLSTLFPTISPGINILANAKFTGTSTNSDLLSGIALASFARVDQKSVFTNDVSVGGNLTLSFGNISYNNNILEVKNRTYQGNINIAVNSVYGSVNGLSIDGNTALARVYADPVHNLGIATKQYVDVGVGSMVDDVQNVANEFYANLAALQVDYLANVNIINTEIASTNSNVINLQSATAASINALSASTTASLNGANASISALSNSTTSSLTAANTSIDTKAPINSPTFTGVARSPTVTQGNNSTVIATTSYVDTLGATLQADYLARFGGESVARNNAIDANVSGLAPINSPAFVGTPVAPTPSSGDSSTRLATTAFVQTTVQSNKFNYTVSSAPPSGGTNGDFWFQIG